MFLPQARRCEDGISFRLVRLGLALGLEDAFDEGVVGGVRRYVGGAEKPDIETGGEEDGWRSDSLLTFWE